jgi:hemerythrin
MRRNTWLADLVREAYPDPDEFETAESFHRAHHDDIPHLTDEELADERFLSRHRRALEREPSDWLRARIARLDAEAARRQQRPAQGRRR